MEVDRNGLEVLARDECLTLLGRATIGRLGVTSGALPTVLPVNYRLIGDQVVFRTSVGTKLHAATTNAVVAFEVDDLDPMEHTGWSVVVTGVARPLDTNQLSATERMAATKVPRWAPEGDGQLVGVSTDLVSGRRIGPVPQRR